MQTNVIVRARPCCGFETRLKSCPAAPCAVKLILKLAGELFPLSILRWTREAFKRHRESRSSRSSHHTAQMKSREPVHKRATHACSSIPDRSIDRSNRWSASNATRDPRSAFAFATRKKRQNYLNNDLRGGIGHVSLKFRKFFCFHFPLPCSSAK